MFRGTSGFLSATQLRLPGNAPTNSIRMDATAVALHRGVRTVRFQRSCYSSIKFTRGASPCNMNQLKWQAFLKVLESKRKNSIVMDIDYIYDRLCPPVLRWIELIRLECPNGGSIIYHYICSNPNGGGIYAKRKLNFDEGYAYHELLFADPPPQGKNARTLSSRKCYRFMLARANPRSRWTLVFRREEGCGLSLDFVR